MKLTIGICAFSTLLGLAVGCGRTHHDGDGAPGSGAASGTGAGGSSASGGTSGTASNVFVSQILEATASKLDLLFMIDNSTSMSDKQNVLALAVPQMVSRFVTPRCVDANGLPTGVSVSANDACAQGEPEFAPARDIHIAVVTSSLGSHGGDVCNSATNADDLGQALGSVRTGLAQWSDTGFLAWDPNGTANTPPGNETNAVTLSADFANMVTAAGQVGCGYEASLEAWYRFLIDPEPPTSVVKLNNVTTKQGINQTLLMQRSQFLRPDSVLAIVMLSDENDCSIADAGFGWFLATRSQPSGGEIRMYRATHFCDESPNDPCCLSCGDSAVPPVQCGLSGGVSADPSCQQNGGMLSAQDDSISLRCWDSKRRFGFDLMYPTERYSKALSSPTICPDSTGYLAGGCASGMVVNPLYDPQIGQLAGRAGVTGTRDPSQVFLAGIVGVPWEDLASDDTRDDPTRLRYLTSDEMSAATPDRWQVVLGDPSNPVGPVLPSDPFMVETDLDRTTLPIPQQNPIVPSAKLQPVTSVSPQANVINGHEQNIVSADDLQYACIFPLNPPKLCMPGMQGCDCAPSASGDLGAVTAYNSPLCQPPGGGAPTATQTYAKAYPGLRFLKVLHDYGGNAIAASICPKITAVTQADFGFNPAMDTVVTRLKDVLRARCLPRALQAEGSPQSAAGTQVGCAVIEAVQGSGSCPPCSASAGRADPDPGIVPAIEQQMKQRGQCDAPGGRTCDSFCFCEIQQETGAASDACRQGPASAATLPGTPAGFCYISNADTGNPCSADADCLSGTCVAGSCAPSPALAKCPLNQQQLLGFVSGQNTATPALGALGFIACSPASVDGG